MTLGSCIFGLVFSIFWCVAAASMGAGFMLIFGIPFVCMMGYRLYVILQMSREEPKQAPKTETDPWERPAQPQQQPRVESSESGFCPYCGSSVETEFAFCPKCGRRLN